eukprot:TRINITY_DN19921_c0_g1_i1.p1 TRINITY_DN19921_c0_g1~~TRINITY_DN19921_c0_g1_i1.p1  ORF type:complete len:209 (+),score=58.38 TRINITY_DN19921_c0_g1_i1:58-627(+)
MSAAEAPDFAWVRSWEDAQQAAKDLTARFMQERPDRASAVGGTSPTPEIALDLAKEVYDNAVSSPRREREVYDLDWSAHVRLMNYFSCYDPKQLPGVVAMLKQFRGHEAALLAACATKHGAEPGTPGAPPAAMSLPLADGWSEKRGRRGHFFYRHQDGRKQWLRPTKQQLMAPAHGEIGEIAAVDEPTW